MAEQTNNEMREGRETDLPEASAPLSFEQAMEKLEAIVHQLESGDVPLEKAITLYQEGMQLAKTCGDKLEQFERKIEMLAEEGGTLTRKPFAPQDKGESGV